MNSKSTNVQTFEKKPVQIHAVQLTPDNIDEVVNWIRFNGGSVFKSPSMGIEIDTLEGSMLAPFGDMIIRGTAGEFYPCKKGIFENLHIIPENFEFQM